MRIGSLNRHVSLQKMAEIQNPDSGSISESWQEVAKVWANIRYLNGTEALKSDAPLSVAKASIRIRLREDVVAKWRVVYGSTIFNILAVLPDADGREYVDLACDTGANDG